MAVLEDKTSRLAALLELLETRGRALPAGAASIRRYKGALDWPARGKVVVPFGRIANPRFPRTFLRSSGWTIDVPTGTPVKAVFAGDVVYAQWLKGYGNLVVLDHGDGVFTLYGHLMTGTVPAGDAGRARGGRRARGRSPRGGGRRRLLRDPGEPDLRRSARLAPLGGTPGGSPPGPDRRSAGAGNRPGAIPYHRAVTKSRLASFLASLALLGTLFVVLPGLGADEKKEKGGKDGLYRPLGLFTEVLSLVRGNYVEKVEVKPLLAGAFSGMTEAMDPFSEYVPPEKMAAFEAARAAREKADHVDSGLVLARRAGYPVVVTAVPGSPAAAAGIETDDLVEKVGGRLRPEPRPLGGRGGALGEAGRPGERPRRARGEAAAADPRDRPGVVDAVAPVGREGLGRARREGARLRGRDGRRPRGDPRPARPVEGPRPRPPRERVRIVGRGRPRRGALRPARPHRRAEGTEDRREELAAEAGQRVHQGSLVLLVDSGTGGPAELFAAALRESAAKELGIDVAAALKREEKKGGAGARGRGPPHAGPLARPEEAPRPRRR